MSQQEVLYTLALSQVRLNFRQKLALLRTLGSAGAVFEQRNDLNDSNLKISAKVIAALQEMESLLPRCEEELQYAQEHHVQVLTYGDETTYPTRLTTCDDAPLVLYSLGNANLNTLHIISIVGTRHCSERGKEWVENFISELSQLLPDTIVVSGLAYGIDVATHKACLKHNMQTIGVLAHGLDEIYPSLHRKVAVEMLKQGGLITEFMSKTVIDKMNFIQRNRIVAGIADATIVVESDIKGGSLITAELANDYHRSVFAVPGRITDQYSSGCNNLIRTNAASLITSANDLLNDLGWKKKQAQPIQKEFFANLTIDEQRVVDCLKTFDGEASLQALLQKTNIPVSALMSMMMNLEIKGVIKTLAGMKYRLANPLAL